MYAYACGKAQYHNYGNGILTLFHVLFKTHLTRKPARNGVPFFRGNFFLSYFLWKHEFSIFNHSGFLLSPILFHAFSLIPIFSSCCVFPLVLLFLSPFLLWRIIFSQIFRFTFSVFLFFPSLSSDLFIYIYCCIISNHK